MSSTATSRNSLLAALGRVMTSLYPTEPDARRALAAVDVDDAKVDFSGSPINRWSHISPEVDRQGCLAGLVRFAVEDRPKSEHVPELAKLAVQLLPNDRELQDYLRQYQSAPVPDSVPELEPVSAPDSQTPSQSTVSIQHSPSATSRPPRWRRARVPMLAALTALALLFTGVRVAREVDRYFARDYLRRHCDLGDGASCLTMFQLEQKNCTAGHADSCLAVGEQQEHGKGTVQDYAAAASSYQRACDAKLMDGCFYLARIYGKGLGLPKIPQNTSLAIELYKQVCEHNELNRLAGCASQAHYLLQAPRTPEREQLARELAERAHNGGNPMGTNNLGMMYDQGLGGLARNPEKANMLYREACDRGEGDGCTNLSITKKIEQGPASQSSALDLAVRGCSLNDSDGCHIAGILHATIAGPQKDATAATKELLKSCELGRAEGCTHLGYFKEHGEYLPKDEVGSVALYDRACTMGELIACYNEALSYKNGTGVVASGEKAAPLFQTACNDGAGSLPACKELGDLYEKGNGVPVNIFQAEKFYQLSCPTHQKTGPGCEELARLHRLQSALTQK